MPTRTTDSGQTSVEYAFVLALVGLAFVVALGGLSGPIGDLAVQIADKITGAL